MILFYGVDAELLAACAPVTRAHRIARAETSRLQAACSALDAFPGAMVVVSTAVGASERDAIAAHAARASAEVTWVDPHGGADELVRAIQSFAAGRGGRAGAPRGLPIGR
jgi:hypothetical protein